MLWNWGHGRSPDPSLTATPCTSTNTSMHGGHGFWCASPGVARPTPIGSPASSLHGGSAFRPNVWRGSSWHGGYHFRPSADGRGTLPRSHSAHGGVAFASGRSPPAEEEEEPPRAPEKAAPPPELPPSPSAPHPVQMLHATLTGWWSGLSRLARRSREEMNAATAGA